MAQSVTSISFRSDAATLGADGGFTFCAKDASSARKSNRVQLGSIELPIQQMSIEDDWSRIHFQERVNIDHDNRRLNLRREYPTQEGVHVETVSLELPMSSNRVVQISVEDNHDGAGSSLLTVKTEHPHAIWLESECIAAQYAVWDEAIEMIGASFGTIDLTASNYDGKLQRVDERTFTVVVQTYLTVDQEQLGWLHAPPPPSPTHMCSLLNTCLRGTALSRGHTFTYSPTMNEFAFEVAAYPPASSSEVRFAVFGDGLGVRLGFGAGMNERVFRRATLDASSMGPGGKIATDAERFLLQQAQGIDLLQRDDTTPLRIRGSPIPWPSIRLRPGWYTPARRSYASSPPQSATAEMSLQFNRLVIKPKEDGGPAIVLIDAAGELKAIQLPVGRFTPQTFCDAANDVLGVAGMHVSLEYNMHTEAFTFSCPRRFALIFSHPMSLEPERLGFESIVYDGLRSYTGSPIHYPAMSRVRGAALSAPKNVYSCVETNTNHHFLRLVAAAPPPQMARIAGRKGGRITLTFTAGGRRSAHGLCVGDVVRLAKLSDGIADASVESLNPSGVRAIVESIESFSTAILHTKVSSWISEGGAVLVRFDIVPTNFCFARKMPSSIEGRRLGFPEKTIQHGVDGHYQFLAPFVHDFDHPDYLLLFIRTGKHSTTNVHHSKESVSSPFAKIVLYPSYREERALTRELILTSGEDLSRFTVHVCNPDLRPYHMHGATWSFTLNHVTSQ